MSLRWRSVSRVPGSGISAAYIGRSGIKKTIEANCANLVLTDSFYDPAQLAKLTYLEAGKVAEGDMVIDPVERSLGRGLVVGHRVVGHRVAALLLYVREVRIKVPPLRLTIRGIRHIRLKRAYPE
jgi:hypothetical protein